MLNDIFINQKEIENELTNMKSQAKDLNNQLALMSQNVAYIFSKIEECKTFEEAVSYLEILDKIQESLACLFCKYNIGLPHRLDRFVRDFDNPDRICKKNHFERIVSKEYSF